MGIEYVDINSVDIDYKLLERLPIKQLIKYNVLPLYTDENMRVVVAFENPADFEAKGAIERFFHGKIMTIAVAKGNMIRKELQRLKISDDVKSFSKEIKHDLTDGAEVLDEKDSPAVLKLIELILITAIE